MDFRWNTTNRIMRLLLLFISLFTLIFLDQLTKWWAEAYLIWMNFPLFWEYLRFELAYNSGIAFSLPLKWFLLSIVTIVLILFLLYQYAIIEYRKKSLLLDCSYILILAWAFCHGYERIVYGRVVDFIAVKYFAILNFADIFIFIGISILIFYYLRYEYSRKHRS